jgi:hypothetical protein
MAFAEEVDNLASLVSQLAVDKLDSLEVSHKSEFRGVGRKKA